MPMPEWKDVLTVIGFFFVLVIWFSIIFLLVFALTACGAIRIEGECAYMREVTTTYYCEPGGTLDSIKIKPTD